jgi:uncharacterized protein (TIGR02270 family)
MTIAPPNLLSTAPERYRKVGLILEVYTEHLEEYQFLWGQRAVALRSPDYTTRDVNKLDDRIKAHVEGLLLGGEAAIPLLEQRLAGDEPLAVFAAAYTLLQMKGSAADRVTEAFFNAEAERLEGFRQALCHGPIDLVEGRLREAIGSAPAPVAAVAWEALLYHGGRENQPARLEELLNHENPAVRCAGWRIVALLDSPGAPGGSGCEID